METWGLRLLEENETARWQNSYVRIWVRRSPVAWRLAYASQTVPGEIDCCSDSFGSMLGKELGFVSAAVLPETADLQWQDFIPTEDGDSIGVFPVLPEHAVVVRPEVPITLGIGRSVSLYGAVPLYLSVRVVQSSEYSQPVRGGFADIGTALLDVPVHTLSQTWFGGPMTGRLCVRCDVPLSYQPVMQIDPLAFAVCPLRVRNITRKPVEIGALAIPTEQLRLFRRVKDKDNFGFWTTSVSAIYTGDEELHLSVVDRKPGVSDLLEPWMPPRVSATDHLFHRGMILLRNITNS